MVQINKGLLLATSIFLISACTQHSKQKSLDVHPMFGDGIYSLRPTELPDQVVTIVKLKGPALFSKNISKVNGKIVLNAADVKALEQEQKETIEELQKISPDIQVIIKYRLVLNALTVVTASKYLPQINTLSHVATSERSTIFGRPVVQNSEILSQAILEDIQNKNSVSFIQGDEAHKMGFRGEGMKVGIIDTGIDYTHTMLGGPGDSNVYNGIDPTKPSSLFPNKKVVGGIDIVGTEFNSGSLDFKQRILRPDLNPLDEAGHGSHVAGTVAGIGDGVQSYSGVAPEAVLYAIKVFGAGGSTSDEAVIAGLEYAADPDGDLSFKNQLDVVNLSLGSSYGDPHLMYSEAIRNLVNGGTVVVASAGNSGNQDYIVGAPSVTNEAISVAASIDGMDHNYKFRAVEFSLANNDVLFEEMIEAAVTSPIATSEFSSGELVHVGIADKDIPPELATVLNGKVALIDRGGGIAFVDKIARAEKAGAVAIVMVNNVDEDAFVMGGQSRFKIPGLMITKSLGTKIKAQMTDSKVVTVNFKSSRQVEKPETVDTITGFSSKGPRSSDGGFKPEIAAPGENIISAGRGLGNKAVQMSGTSMAGPHIAGVMALLKQAKPNLSVLELKSLLMSHGKVLKTVDGQQDLLSRQGAGRVQIADSLNSVFLSEIAAISLGLVPVDSKKMLRKQFSLKNISANKQKAHLFFKGSSGYSVDFKKSEIELGANESTIVTANITIKTEDMKNYAEEKDGFIQLLDAEGKILYQIPVMAVVLQSSAVSAEKLLVHSTSQNDASESAVDLKLNNKSKNSASALVFNLLDFDARKKSMGEFFSRGCDLQTVGYRILNTKDSKGNLEQVMQFGFKLYSAVTTWQACEVNVQFDLDGDSKTDIEVASVPSTPASAAMTVVLDAAKARTLRATYDAEIKAGKTAELNMGEAAIDARSIFAPSPSAIAVLEVKVSDLKVLNTTVAKVKISTAEEGANTVEEDDYTSKSKNQWLSISLAENQQSFYGMEEATTLLGAKTTAVELTKGSGHQPLLILVPENVSNVDENSFFRDQQALVMKPKYLGN